MSVLGLRAPSRGTLRIWGLIIAVGSVILPSLPLGGWFAQPPIPHAVLWAAYGWAAEDESSWRAPVVLALLGLLHDQLSFAPYGLFVALYLSAYLIGRIAAVIMSAPNILSLWAGFAVTAIITVGVARVLAPIGIGPNTSVSSYLDAVLITIALFPLVRPLYMASGPSTRRQQAGARA
jgi:hypothetical protein